MQRLVRKHLVVISRFGIGFFSFFFSQCFMKINFCLLQVVELRSQLEGKEQEVVTLLESLTILQQQRDIMESEIKSLVRFIEQFLWFSLGHD